MNPEFIIAQTKAESRALEHVTRALEIMLGWSVAGDGYSRKLSSVRFFTELYQRHLERLFALEEVDGFMENIVRLKPERASEVNALKKQHEEFRVAVRKSLVRIDLTSPQQLAEFDETCGQLRRTINGVLDHLRQESDLLVQTFTQDTGGEA
jgi:hypothetical protein